MASCARCAGTDSSAHARVLSGDFTEEAGMAAATDLLDSTLPTAVVCANDHCAIGVMDRLRRAGVSVPSRFR